MDKSAFLTQRFHEKLRKAHKLLWSGETIKVKFRSPDGLSISIHDLVKIGDDTHTYFCLELNTYNGSEVIVKVV
jgi:hypothetical protein